MNIDRLVTRRDARTAIAGISDHKPRREDFRYTIDTTPGQYAAHLPHGRVVTDTNTAGTLPVVDVFSRVIGKLLKSERTITRIRGAAEQLEREISIRDALLPKLEEEDLPQLWQGDMLEQKIAQMQENMQELRIDMAAEFGFKWTNGKVDFDRLGQESSDDEDDESNEDDEEDVEDSDGDRSARRKKDPLKEFIVADDEDEDGEQEYRPPRGSRAASSKGTSSARPKNVSPSVVASVPKRRGNTAPTETEGATELSNVAKGKGRAFDGDGDVVMKAAAEEALQNADPEERSEPSDDELPTPGDLIKMVGQRHPAVTPGDEPEPSRGSPGQDEVVDQEMDDADKPNDQPNDEAASTQVDALGELFHHVAIVLNVPMSPI